MDTTLDLIEGPPATRRDAMQAIVQDRYGDADVLRLATIERPEPADDEALVHVRAAGVDRGAWHLMTGLPYAVRLAGFGIRRPKQPVRGMELAGEVTAVGAEVTRFRPGDAVYGIGDGTFAEYSVAKESKLARKPDGLSFERAAAVPISAPTALQALREQGQVREGQRVLILGASGGVGTYAVQLAKAFGADVTGVASTTKLDLVASLGADHVLDYSREGITDRGQRYDLIVDLGGNRPLRELRGALTRGGTLVIGGGEGGGRLLGGTDRQLRAMAWSPFLPQKLGTFIAKERSQDLDDLAPLLESGQLVPVVDGTYPLQDVPRALRDLAAGRVRGKAVISI